MAIELGLVDWDDEMLLEAILLCFEDFVAEERASEMEDDRLLETIEARLRPEDFPLMRKDAWLDEKPAVGFRRRFKTYDLYCLRAAVFTTWVGSKSRTRRMYVKLHEAGRLVLWDKANAPSPTNKEWAEGTAKWSEKSKFRAVRVRVPREA